jgi:hypothetical protein
MNETAYSPALKQAQKDLTLAMKRRDAAFAQAREANEQIVQLRRAITALAVLAGENVEDSMGLTDAVRVIFSSRHEWTSAKELKDHVEAIGVSLSDLKNADASMLSVLNRLTTASELLTGIKKVKNANGSVADVRVWRPNPEYKPPEEDDIPF